MKQYYSQNSKRFGLLRKFPQNTYPGIIRRSNSGEGIWKLYIVLTVNRPGYWQSGEDNQTGRDTTTSTGDSLATKNTFRSPSLILVVILTTAATIIIVCIPRTGTVAVGALPAGVLGRPAVTGLAVGPIGVVEVPVIGGMAARTLAGIVTGWWGMAGLAVGRPGSAMIE